MLRRSRSMLAAAALAVGMVPGLLSAPVAAQTQTLSGTVTEKLTMTTAPTDSVSWTLTAGATNTTAGGKIVVDANVPWTLTVAGQRARLTEWDGTAYGSATLQSGTTVTPTLNSGVAVPAPVVVGTTAQTLATSGGLVVDDLSLSLDQPVLIGDKPGNYRNVFTYTLSKTL